MTRFRLSTATLSLLLVLVVLVPLAALPSAVAAASITLTQTTQVSFPNSITFNIKAQSTAPITQLRLHYVINRENFASVVSEGWPQYTASANVSMQWVLDNRRVDLPPGSKVDYWWTAVDSAGNQGTTARTTVPFDDTRFKWQTIASGPVTLEWYSGSRSFADTLMAAAQQGLQRIENDTGATPKGSVTIYIYASAQDLQSAQLFAQPWEGGATFQGFDIIAIGVQTDQVSYGQRAVPHELTHWIVHQVTFNNYGADIPVWLDEGLATYGEGTVAPEYQSALNDAIKNNTLLSVRSLSSPFSAIPSVAYTSYGESNSIARFLIQKYGKDKMVQLLNVFHDGAGYDDALKKVYGFDQDGLNTQWMQSIGAKG